MHDGNVSFEIAHELLPSLRVAETTGGRLVLLNGASSSGKSSIAEELLLCLAQPYFHLSVDQFHASRGRKPWTEDQFLPVFQRTILGFHRAVVGLASAGNNVVVDHILAERWRLLDCLAVFAELEVLFVAVQCPLEALNRRERDRGNRQVGRAASQSGLVHSHGPYDVTVDTGSDDAKACAQQIKHRLESGEPFRAFERLRDGLGSR